MFKTNQVTCNAILSPPMLARYNKGYLTKLTPASIEITWTDAAEIMSNVDARATI